MERNGNENGKTLPLLETERSRRLHHLRHYFNLLLINPPRVRAGLLKEDFRALFAGNEELVNLLFDRLREVDGGSNGKEQTIYKTFIDEQGRIMFFDRGTRAVSFPFEEAGPSVILSRKEADCFIKLVDSAGCRVSGREFSDIGSVRQRMYGLRKKLKGVILGGDGLIESSRVEGYYMLKMEPLSPELRAQK